MQQIARVNLIFGLHVHVGIPDREEAIDIINQARYFLPHIYALLGAARYGLDGKLIDFGPQMRSRRARVAT